MVLPTVLYISKFNQLNVVNGVHVSGYTIQTVHAWHVQGPWHTARGAGAWVVVSASEHAQLSTACS